METNDFTNWQLRIEIPSEKDDNDPLNKADVAEQIEIFKRVLRGTKQLFFEKEIKSCIEGEFIDTVEYVLNLRPQSDQPTSLLHNRNAKDIMDTIKTFFSYRRYIEKDLYVEPILQIPEEYRASIILYSPWWFMPEIDSCKLDISLSKLDFGTFFNNGYNSHWTIYGQESDGQDHDVTFEDSNNNTRYSNSSYYSQTYIRGRRGMSTEYRRNSDSTTNSNNTNERNRSYDKDIKLDFLFDQNQVVVRFWNKEQIRDYGEDFESNFVLYRVQVLMQNIRRVVLDLRRDVEVIYLDLVNPPIIKRSNAKSMEEIEDKVHKRWISIRRGLQDNKGYCSEEALVENTTLRLEFLQLQNFTEFWHWISRLRHRCNIPIEFQRIEPNRDNMYRKPKPNAYPHLYASFVHPKSLQFKEDFDMPMTHPEEGVFQKFLNETFAAPLPFHEDNEEHRAMLKRDRVMVHYLIEALLSRGASVKDHLFLNSDGRYWISFLRMITQFYRRNTEAAVEALKRLMSAIDEQKRIYDIKSAFSTLYHKIRTSGEECGLSEEKVREGYMLVPRIVITPTRHLRIQPEMCMGNRVLRNQAKDDPCVIIRVSFRDDDNTLMRTTKTSDYLLERTIKGAFDNGLFVAGRRYYYLGSSSSQMRDCGAYFMLGVTDGDRKSFAKQFPNIQPDDPRLSIKILRNNLGRFLSLKTAPKIMARLGQCFTQSRESGVSLRRHDYIVEADIVGGRKKLVNQPYIFTDGVGSISPQFAKRMADDMHLASVPSCFQYRFRGHKGVQVVDKNMEELAEWARKYNIESPPGHKDIQGTWELSCIFRPSQIKFSAKRFDEQSIEVVKYSGPTSVCLNKPLINIFDQVTQKQSYECHQRVVNRIEHLLSLQIRNMVRMLLEERYCRNKLKELPNRINIDCLRSLSGFELCCEPFFASLLRANVRFTIFKQLRKEQIQIPPSLGRSMLGVNDITNRLQYGQVFVQYHNDIRDYSPHLNASKTVVTGKVMVTKNPTSVGGDLRVFDAVDIPELHHLVDVIVFPVHGPRSMPDEMAGSDLDGDEYSVFWDPELVIDCNMKAATYETEPREVDQVAKEDLDNAVRDAFVDYIKKDNIGVISNALLFQSDLYGIDSKVVNDLAVKANMALEFLKSGVAPERLRNQWDKPNDKYPEWLPPEKPERYPDFHFGNDYCPVYYSPRLTGKLYREIKLVEDVLRIVEENDLGKDLELDKLLEVDGWQGFTEEVTREMDVYIGKIRMVLETYGIKTEAELISGCICDMRSRITDKDQDDFSYYNQRSTIESRVTEIMREARENFFASFGGWKYCTYEVDARDADNVFRRKCNRMSTEVRQKASAYYMINYQKFQRYRNGQVRILSFAWLVFDILGAIRQDKVYYLEDHSVYDKPILRILENRIQEINIKSLNKKRDFISKRQLTRLFEIYCTKYEGLADVMFVLEQWARLNKYTTNRLTEVHIHYLLILFATGKLGALAGEPQVFVEWLPLKISNKELRSEQIIFRNKGELLLKFFEFIGSRKFKTQKYLSFDKLGISSTFLRGEWLVLNQAAFKTYLTIAFSMHFDFMDSITTSNTIPKLLRELDPFVIELPASAKLPEVEKRLKDATGVTEVKLRYITARGRTDRAVVVCRGPLEACYKLKSLVAVRPSHYVKYPPKELSEMLPEITLQNIFKVSEFAEI